MRDVQQDLDLDLYSKDATRYDENYKKERYTHF
jgi:hypothetical protein